MSAEQWNNQLSFLKSLSEFGEALTTFSQTPALERVDALFALMQDFEYPARSPDYADDWDKEIELLRTLEIHGVGLRPYQADARFVPGDVIVARDRTVWLVATTDDKGRITEITGAPKVKAGAMDFQLTWRPAKEARIWLRKGETVAPGYSNLDEALRSMIRLWGAKQSDAGGDLGTPTGFFLSVAKAPGLKIDHDELGEYPEAGDVIQFCNKRGEGLRTFDEEAGALPGDLLLMKAKKAWALVTRCSEAGTPEDALIAGLSGRGQLGEPTGSLKLVRDIRPKDIDRIWKPS